MFKAKFVDFASFVCLFGQTHNNNRDTLCSWVCAFIFCLNLLHQFVMLGPKQPYHKKHSPEKVGQQSPKDHGANYWGAQYGSVYSRTDLHDPGLFTNFSHNYAKTQNNLSKTNLSYPNCQFFMREWLNCRSNSDSLHRKLLAGAQPPWRLDVTHHGQLTPTTPHPRDRCV